MYHIELQPKTSLMNERFRRIWAATEARDRLGGGFRTAAATGMARNTVKAGMRGRGRRSSKPERVRLLVGGRKHLSGCQPKLLGAVEEFAEPTTRGDPQSRLAIRR
jgi:hypothetical protein